MTQPLSARMALVPLFDQRVPGRLSRSPNVRHPASTTPLPTWMPRGQHSSYRIRSMFPRKDRTHAATSPYRARNGSSSRTTFATRPQGDTHSTLCRTPPPRSPHATPGSTHIPTWTTDGDPMTHVMIRRQTKIANHYESLQTHEKPASHRV